MNEDQLRRALHAHGDSHDPAQPSWSAIEARAATSSPSRRRWAIPSGLGALAAAVVAITVVVTRPDPRTELLAGDDPTTVSTSMATTTTAPPFPDPATVGGIYPDRAAYERDGIDHYRDPEVAAVAFAKEYLGMKDPQLQPATTELEKAFDVTPNKRASITTRVELFQVDREGPWTVVGAATAGIVPDLTGNLPVTSPLTLTGRAWAFEGHVAVQLRLHGDWHTPWAETYVIGRGDELGPFRGSLRFATPPTALGTLLFLEPSAEDGSTLAATVVQVRFG